MPLDMQSRHGNWIHLHQHPCIAKPGTHARRDSAARFLFLASGANTHKPCGRIR